MEGIRRIEVKGRSSGNPSDSLRTSGIRQRQLGDSYWLYVVWDPLQSPSTQTAHHRNPVKHLDHAKRQVIAARHYDIPAQAVEGAARSQGSGS